MSIHIEWSNQEKTVILLHYQGRWNWEEYRAAIHELQSMICRISYPIDVIHYHADPQSAITPRGALVHWQAMLHNSPKNLRTIVMASDNPLIHTLVSIMGEIVSRGHHTKFYGVTTLAEAWTLLAKIYE